jgi:hypothetical protein
MKQFPQLHFLQSPVTFSAVPSDKTVTRKNGNPFVSSISTKLHQCNCLLDLPWGWGEIRALQAKLKSTQQSKPAGDRGGSVVPSRSHAALSRSQALRQLSHGLQRGLFGEMHLWRDTCSRHFSHKRLKHPDGVGLVRRSGNPKHRSEVAGLGKTLFVRRHRSNSSYISTDVSAVLSGRAVGGLRRFQGEFSIKLVCNHSNAGRKSSIPYGIRRIAMSAPNAIDARLYGDLCSSWPRRRKIAFGSHEKRELVGRHLNSVGRNVGNESVHLILETLSLFPWNVEETNAARRSRSAGLSVPDHPSGDAFSRHVSHGKPKQLDTGSFLGPKCDAAWMVVP